jgi:uncharacterized protein YecT (DUF1311 family)
VSRLLAVLAAGAWLLARPAWAEELPVKTLSIEKSTAKYEIKIEYPSTGNQAIDREIVVWAKQQTNDWIKNANSEPPIQNDGYYSLDWSFEVARNDGAVFAVIFSADSFSGGAHPNHDIATFNFEVPSGWRLYLPEIFDGQKALSKISALAIADLVKQKLREDGGSDSDERDGAGPEWGNFSRFILQPDTLEIHYPDYQVAPYAAGPQETDLALADLAGLTRANRHVPVASFDCLDARATVEKAICSDVALARLDRDVAEAFLLGVKYATEDAAKDKLKTEQRAWLTKRDADCPTAAVRCLTAAYRDRLAKLQKAIE